MWNSRRYSRLAHLEGLVHINSPFSFQKKGSKVSSLLVPFTLEKGTDKSWNKCLWSMPVGETLRKVRFLGNITYSLNSSLFPNFMTCSTPTEMMTRSNKNSFFFKPTPFHCFRIPVLGNTECELKEIGDKRCNCRIETRPKTSYLGIFTYCLWQSL